MTKALAPQKVFAGRVFSELMLTLLLADIRSGMIDREMRIMVRVLVFGRVQCVPRSTFRDIQIHRYGQFNGTPVYPAVWQAYLG